MVGVDRDCVFARTEYVAPFFKSRYYRSEFLVVNVIVAFGRGEFLGVERCRMPFFVFLAELG